ncbi:hypothetical protein NDU88_001990 [Pleurodeles waltl]|uniref:Uncharacterized protein n=1 Tax=Pleurodeles waltl TaxID=8319 RepID=A0AAV7SBE4_PLEWA|nr:hypothetical protein NDU88_001990 [Pleurodeles waltl]
MLYLPVTGSPSPRLRIVTWSRRNSTPGAPSGESPTRKCSPIRISGSLMPQIEKRRSRRERTLSRTRRRNTERDGGRAEDEAGRRTKVKSKEDGREDTGEGRRKPTSSGSLEEDTETPT